MFKPLTLSLSLAVALGACSVSMAGIFASSQCATPQSPCASSQSCLPSAQSSCLPKKHWNFHLPKPCFTYEWVLKKKMVWSCGNSGCATCPTASAQCGPSSQILGSGQSYGSGQAYPTTYGSGQVYGGMYGGGAMTATAPAAGVMTPAPTGDEAPPAPEVAPAAPAAPEAPAPAAPAPPAPSAPGPQSSLLFSTPSGN